MEAVAILTVGIIFLGIDAIWLKSMRGFYERELGSLLLKKPLVSAAIIFYLIYVIGMSLLVVLPALQQNTAILEVMLRGGLVGLMAYATYDLTNLATLKNWSYKVAIVDSIWGMIVSSISVGITVWLLQGWV